MRTAISVEAGEEATSAAVAVLTLWARAAPATANILFAATSCTARLLVYPTDRWTSNTQFQSLKPRHLYLLPISHQHLPHHPLLLPYPLHCLLSYPLNCPQLFPLHCLVLFPQQAFLPHRFPPKQPQLLPQAALLPSKYASTAASAGWIRTACQATSATSTLGATAASAYLTRPHTCG